MDIKLHYIEKGKGFPLILLHGNGEGLEYFEHQIAYFSRQYRVIAVDTRGHGRSPRGEGPFTLEQFAEDLKLFMDQMEIKKAIILGFSDGGNIATLFALKYQEYVVALILNGADLHPSGVKKSIQIPICIGYGMVLLMTKFSRRALAKKEMMGLMVTQPNIPRRALAQIKIPVLVIVGTKDMITLAHTQEIHRHLPQSKLVVIEGDHFIAGKKPDAFNKEVEEFLMTIKKEVKKP